MNHHVGGLPLIEPDSATGRLDSLFAVAQHTLGLTPNLTKAMANSPAVLEAYLAVVRALRAGRLPAATRERIAIFVAQEHGCDYCLSVHTYLATTTAGMTLDDAAMARHGLGDDPALPLAADVLRTHGATSEKTLAAARAAGMDDEQIAEVVAHVALNGFTTYFANLARAPVDWPRRTTGPVTGPPRRADREVR